MTTQAYIFELSAKSFPESALQNSFRLPVLVEFMGVWSGPCINMASRLSDLAKEFAGEFIFAQVDIDEHQELGKQYGIENVPTLIVLRNGEELRREVGEMQEPELRALLREFGIFRQSDELREQARERHIAGDTPEAIMLLAQAIQSDPGNVRVAMDMVQIFLDVGEVQQAQALFNRLPNAVREGTQGKSLTAQIKFSELAAKTEGVEALQHRLAANADDHDARFDLAICLVARHQIDQAVEQLFQIQQAEPVFRDGAAREMISLLSNMLMESAPDAANAYRRRLANMLNDT